MDDIEIIYQKYYKYVKSYTLSLCLDESLAEEITQETFYKAITSYDSFDHRCKIQTWLCRIAHNIFVNLKRKKQHEDIDSILHLAADCNIEEDFSKKEDIRKILRISTTLETPYKEVFYMRTLGDFSYAVIADAFCKTESWARVTYHRAKQKIIERMTDND